MIRLVWIRMSGLRATLPAFPHKPMLMVRSLWVPRCEWIQWSSADPARRKGCPSEPLHSNLLVVVICCLRRHGPRRKQTSRASCSSEEGYQIHPSSFVLQPLPNCELHIGIATHGGPWNLSSLRNVLCGRCQKYLKCRSKMAEVTKTLDHLSLTVGLTSANRPGAPICPVAVQGKPGDIAPHTGSKFCIHRIDRIHPNPPPPSA